MELNKTIEKTIDPLGDAISSVALIRISGGDVDVVNAARVSFGKKITAVSQRDEKLIQFLMEHQHTTPFEHNQLSFRIKCPIFVSRQWMRHRMNSYNEISYRYAKAPLEFYTPSKWRYQDKANKQGSTGSFEDNALTKLYSNCIEQCAQTYQILLESGVSRELASRVLPFCTYTQFIFTTNLHSLMHFLRLRLHEGAQFEIQQYAKAMLSIALDYFPVSLNAWKKKYMPNLELSCAHKKTVPSLEETLDL